MLNLPNEFLSRMQNILGAEYDAFLSSLDNPIEKAIYVNENKICVDKFKDVIDFPIEEIPYERAGFYTNADKRGRHPLHHAGAFYIQEPNAMFTVNAHRFRGDELVLDMCAAPGGKSIQIANKIPNGTLVSNEYVPSRSKILLSNIERMGLRNVVITNDTPERIAKAYANTFDVVLVDAPCSGEGMFRRGAEVVAEWNVGVNKKCKIRQLAILDEADKCLKQGGTLIYSTCTYSLDENEEVVRDFLLSHEYELVKIENNTSAGVIIDNLYEYDKCVRLYPHISRGEGQFVAVMKKLAENDLYPAGSVKLNNSTLATKFLKEYVNCNINTKETNNRIYHINNEALIKKGINYVSCGVLLGDIVKNRFEPAHNLYTAFGFNFINKFELDYRSSDVNKYLRGEELDLDFEDCYGAVLVNGCALGGFKISNGKFKNHYPKGLRNTK